MRARSFEYLISEATRVLAELPEHVWDGESLPVPIESIAEDHYGLLIREVGEIANELPEDARHDIPDGKLSGALIPELAEIWVDATEASLRPSRRRYTIAHELGHWELHRGPDQTLCREGAVDTVETVTNQQGSSPQSWNEWKQPGAEPQVEWEANVFGGALLLPPSLVREVWDREQSVEALAEAFDCSESAIDPRWLQHYAHGG
ncbi:MAG TPA: ImmA/IrrE family metallo-endopeptidase [Solirubrobacterales bacterium]|nr:ImmA/IrrE family metallo-endopeptidase [Solirubrobacterales bacterium]